MNKTLRCSLLFLISLGLVGCGLKGPLYMPPQSASDKQETQQPTDVDKESTNTQVGDVVEQ